MAPEATVIGALRRFLPDFLRVHPIGDRARRRAIWALTHCRTATMGGHVHACEKCGTTHFAFHSCNHRSCPQCGKQDTADWVERELAKRIGAPLVDDCAAQLRHPCALLQGCSFLAVCLRPSQAFGSW
jgi:hypothetical protein